jgi:hypothetical protein
MFRTISLYRDADDLVLMAKEETVLQGMIDKLIEIGSCYGMEMNVEKTKVIRISRQPSPVAEETHAGPRLVKKCCTEFRTLWYRVRRIDDVTTSIFLNTA